MRSVARAKPQGLGLPTHVFLQRISLGESQEWVIQSRTERHLVAVGERMVGGHDYDQETASGTGAPVDGPMSLEIINDGLSVIEGGWTCPETELNKVGS